MISAGALRFLLASGSATTGTAIATILGTLVVVGLIVTVRLILSRSNRRRRDRPFDVRAAEVAAQFDGRPTVRVYPLYTGLTADQMASIAEGRGYRFRNSTVSNKGNRVFIFDRIATEGR